MKRNSTKSKTIAVMSAVVITAIVLLFLGVGGGIEYQFDDSSFLIHTALWKDWTVTYADIGSIELRDDIDTGKRINGYGSGKLSLGTFQNSEFGTYQLYSYTECDQLVVLHFKDHSILAISGEDKMVTENIYEAICARLITP